MLVRENEKKVRVKITDCPSCGEEHEILIPERARGKTVLFTCPKKGIMLEAKIRG